MTFGTWRATARNRGIGKRLALIPAALLLLLSPLAFAAVGGQGSAAPTSATCMGKKATIVGTAGADRLNGTAGRDVIAAGAGADRVDARGGQDLVCGGPGADRIAGGGGADQLRGEGGNDRIDGGGDVDRCEGGGGSNTLLHCERDNVPQTTPVNRSPVAADESATTDERTPVTINLLAGASDPDGDALTVSSIDTSGTNGAVTLAGGLATFNPDGRFEALAVGDSASDRFGFTVNDSRGLATHATVVVAVTGVDDPPVAVDDEASVDQNAAGDPIEVLSNDTDVDGGPRSITEVSQPEHGTVAIDGEGSGLSYDPEAGYCNDGEAADTFTYTLNGGSIGTVSVSVACETTVTAGDELEPAFDPEIPDYTVHCDNSPLNVSGRTAAGATVAIDGGAPTTGPFETSVPLQENQEFSFEVADASGPQSYHVRCLPSDFPTWDYEGLRTPSHQFYTVSPTLGAGAPHYGVIFDAHGVPVWWKSEFPASPSDMKVLPSGEIAWWSSPRPTAMPT